MRGATRGFYFDVCFTAYFNPRSSWEERQNHGSKCKHKHYFNPRSSWEERLSYFLIRYRSKIFQSTLLVRGATNVITVTINGGSISIHAPRERSDAFIANELISIIISIHAPRERSDLVKSAVIVPKAISIHAPRERSDQSPLTVRYNFGISIHAPRERSDKEYNLSDIVLVNFNPRSSWEERHLTIYSKC